MGPFNFDVLQYRIATDIYGFLGRKGFKEVLRGYGEVSGERAPKEYERFLVTYCNLINWPYMYMFIDKEPWRKQVAEKYERVIMEVSEGA